MDFHRKIKSRAELVQLRRELADRRRTVVFTNGCFDILHRGHVEYLAQAAALGDVLIVGLNSDASVQRLKGPARPLVPQQDRALVLAALSMVDYVTIFEEDTPLELITALEPDVLVKGGDYRPEEIVGREVVEARGGRVLTIPLVPGRSTTGLMEKIVDLVKRGML